MDSALEAAIRTLHKPDGWVHLATTGKDGTPHVAPMMMGIHGDTLTFSLTGQQKKINRRRDPRCCVSISEPGTVNHVIIWGTMDIRWDAADKPVWEDLIRGAFGEEGLAQRQMDLSWEGRSLGLLTPIRWRIFLNR